MNIELATTNDFLAVAGFDRGLPVPRLVSKVEAGEIYTLKDGVRLMGYLRYSLFWDTVPFINLLVIDPSFRGQGLGRKMVDAWESKMAENGFSMAMTSSQSDETSQEFFIKMGYENIGNFSFPEQASEMLFLKHLSVN